MRNVIFAIDCETTGLCFGSQDPSLGHQALSFAVICADYETYKTLDRFYIEIKWDGVSEWTESAAKIHGLTKEHLEKNGVSKEDAALEIAEFILSKMPDKQRNVSFIGHNVNFDVSFLRRLFTDAGIEDFPFSHRHIDTFTLGKVLFNCNNSSDLFYKFGIDQPTPHNAMADAEAAIKVVKTISSMWNLFVNQ